MHIISWEFGPGSLQTALCIIQFAEGSLRAFVNLDLPIKYAPYPKLHGLKWRHKHTTNHSQTQGRRAIVLDTETTGSTLAEHTNENEKEL